MESLRGTDVFRIASTMAGELVFHYDLDTGKMMQYSAREEFTKYGSFVYGFREALEAKRSICPDDFEKYDELCEMVTSGNKGYYENELRMSLIGSNEYHWYHVVAKTIYDDNNNPSSVIGIIKDVEDLRNRLLRGAGIRIDTTSDLMGSLDFMDYIAKYERTEKSQNPAVCILCRISQYNDYAKTVPEEQAEELIINISRRIRRCFNMGTRFARVGSQSFGIFSGNADPGSEVIPSIDSLVMGVRGMGISYELDLTVEIGVCIMPYEEFVSNPKQIYSKAAEALRQATINGKGSIVFYKEEVKPENADKD